MSNPIFNIKEGDLLPALEVSMLDADGQVVDLTGCTARFHMGPLGGGSATIDAAASITDATAGQVSYSWVGFDTSTADTYLGEFEITFPGGKTETFPNDRFIAINILAGLA